MSDAPETPSRLERARREAEARLRDLRLSLQREVGTAPSRKGLWLLIAAGAVGLALAVGTTAVRRHKVRRPQKKLPGMGSDPDSGTDES